MILIKTRVANMSNNRVRLNNIDDIAKIRKGLNDYAKSIVQHSVLPEEQKREMLKPLEHDAERTKKVIDENRDDLLMAQMRGTNWDDIPLKAQQEMIALWKKKNPGWDNRKMIFESLRSNTAGSNWGYINNIIASISPIIIAPKPGTGLGTDEDSFYGTYYPLAATIFWWATLYEVSATRAIKWNTIIYIPNIKQTVVLGGQELSNTISNHSFGISTFLLGAVAIVVVAVRLI